MRTIAIGDIHGCCDALDGLLQAIQPMPSDTLIFLGDYVDRGPHSKEVIDRLIDLQQTCQTVFLRGNHDWVLLEWADEMIDRTIWETIGGGLTLQSYGIEEPHQFPTAHRAFFEACRNYHETETHIFAHACYRPNLSLADTDLESLLWCHLSWPLPQPHQSGKIVVVGHTPQTCGSVADFGHLVCIDTFCFGGGRLTAYDVDRREALQVDRCGRVTMQWGGVETKSWLGKMIARLLLPRNRATCKQTPVPATSGEAIN